MRAAFITPASNEWDEILLGLDHDFYHLPGYVRLSAQHQVGEPLAFVAQERDSVFLVPLIVRPVEHPLSTDQGQLFDATSPYGYSSPLLNLGPAETADDFLQRAVKAFLMRLKERGIVSAFVRLHPLFPLPPGSLSAVGRVVHHGQTVSVDLTLTCEEIWRQTRKNHRRDIVNAARSGQLIARVDCERASFDSFMAIYLETMSRRQAQPFYHFSREYFEELRRVLGDALHFCVVEFEGQAAAAGLFTESHGIVQYYLSGTRSDFLQYRPAKTMLHYVRCWAKQRGNWILHLGGGLGMQADGLYEFKAGFSNARHPFFSWQIVVDEPMYRVLADHWNARHEGVTDDDDGFFPAYRRPASA